MAVVDGAPLACCVVGDEDACGGAFSTASQDARTRLKAIKDEMRRVRLEARGRRAISLAAWFAMPPLSVRAGHYRRATCIFESRFVSRAVELSHMTPAIGGGSNRGETLTR